MLPEFSEPTDRFTAETRIGSGGMADIFKGIDRETGQAVAIKFLRASASSHERQRFAREIAVLADLRHPNIVQYIAHGTWHDGRVFFAMEWLDGEDLGQRQRRAPLGMRDAVEIVRRSAAAMAAIHARGVTHRDLKLSNIFLVRGKGTAIKLIDFGVVKPAVADEFPTERGSIIGTPHFMAPEQARGEDIDARSDVYALGSVLFRLVTGRNVFETEHVIALLGRLVLEDPPNPQSLRFDVPDALDQVILRAIQRKKDFRYENGGEFARALARVGSVNNDPPATDRSSSAIRRAVPDVSPPSSAGEAGEVGHVARRPGTNERRVVAVVLFDLGPQRTLSPEVEASVRDVLGDDTRLEPLLGGQLVAVLGVERSKGDEAMRAARAALTVAGAMQDVKVTVALGHAVRARGNLAGEALERAAQQLDLATPGTVRLDHYALAALEGRFVVQEDGAAGPRSGMHPDGGGGVLLREDASGFGARQLLGRPTPTVGREKEIALLQGIYGELTEDGAPRAALVLGSAGIGKSRVRSELLQRLELSPTKPIIFVCRGDPMSRASSLSALGRSIRQHMGVHDGEQPFEQVLKVKQQVSANMPRTLRFLAGFLGELVGVSFPDDADEPLRAARASAQLMQSRLRMALESYVRAHEAPVVIVVEDTHWADDTTLELLDWLLGCPDLNLCVFAFARPEITTRAPQLWDKRSVTRLTLAPLSPLAADRLVAAALPNADAATRGTIVRRAGGNALFLEELVRCAAEGREELPLTVQAVLQHRLDRMGPEAREVLRAASVFGQSFWTGGVEKLLERTIDLEIAELVQAEIINKQPESRIAGQDEWIFRQALVRDTGYASLLTEDRGVLHLAAGAWLESVGDVDAGLIARHADAGGDLPRAALLYAKATRQAYTNGAQLETAYELANRGLACGAEGDVRAELLLAKAQVAWLMGKLEDAIASADEAGRLVPAASDVWAEAQRLLASTLIESGRSRDGDARAAWALGADFWHHLSQPSRANLLSARVRGLVDMNMPREALEVADAALDEARGASETNAITRALDARLYALMQIGDMSRAIAAGTLVIEAADSTGDMVLATRGRVNTASVLNQLGFYEEAQALLERALPDAKARRMRILEGSTLQNLGMCHARLGRLDDAILAERQAARLADECGAARLRVNARIYEAVMLSWRGGPGDLGLALNTARWACEETRSHPGLYTTALFTLARVQLGRHEVAGALEVARDAARRLDAAPVEEWEEGIRLTLVQALLESGLDLEAKATLDRAFSALCDRAAGILNPAHRESFLTRNGEAAALVALADQLLAKPLPRFAPPPPSRR